MTLLFFLSNEQFVTVRSAVLQCVNLKTDTIKLIGIIFSHDESLENNKNYRKHIIKMEKLLKLRRMRQLTI